MSTNSEAPGLEEIAFMDLKSKIVKLMFDFTEKYELPEDRINRGKLLVDVLTACLSEAQYQVANYQPLTYKQEDFICWQIGEWYLYWKNNLTDPYVPHKLGYAKEQLKEMLCSGETGPDKD